MSEGSVMPDLVSELRAVQRARTDDRPSLQDIDALLRAIAMQRDPERKLWTPDVLNGLLQLGIDADEWQAIDDSCREAFVKLGTSTMFPNDDFSREGFVLGFVRCRGVEEAAENEFITKALGEILREGKAEFFEKLAATIRESRKPDAPDWMMPDDTLKDRATWTLVIGWNQSPFPQFNFPPFAFWSYDAITVFCEEIFKITYGREGIRRRISEIGLRVASIVLVRGLEYERDSTGFRLIFKKRRRSVKGHKSDKS